MTFIPKSPISSPEVENVNNKPPKGTRAIFAKSDGWYMIDSDGNELKIATTSDINNSDETFIISANYTGEFSGFFAFDLSIDKSYDEMVDAYISGKTLLFKLTNNDKVFYLGLSEVLKGHALDENGENYIFDFRSKDISNSVVCDIICVKIDNGGAVLEFTESTTFIDAMPVKDSQYLITSGGVYEALQKIPSGGGGEAVTQPHYIFDAYLTITDGKLRVDSFESVENITEAFNSGRMVIAQTQMQYLDADENLITVDSTCLIATSPYTFFGVTSKNDHIFIQYATSWIGSVSEAVSKNYVDTAIGDIESSLENIINKYGLGGEA